MTNIFVNFTQNFLCILCITHLTYHFSTLGNHYDPRCYKQFSKSFIDNGEKPRKV